VVAMDAILVGYVFVFVCRAYAVRYGVTATM